MSTGKKKNVGRNDYDFEQLSKEERKALRMKKRRREIAMMRAVIVVVSVLIVVLAAFLIRATIKKGKAAQTNTVLTPGTQGDVGDGIDIAGDDFSGDDAADNGDDAVDNGDDAVDNGDDAVPGDAGDITPPASGEIADILKDAELLAAGYDYDAALAMLRDIPDYESQEAVTAAITSYETEKASCVAVDVDTVPHIFYHSLVNDPSISFNADLLGQSSADGMNAWMTTVDEFDKITQQLYDNGYVYVRLRDLVNEYIGEDGQVHFEPNTQLMLPPDKKAIVLSVDDLSYYHSYEPASFPEKLVLNDEGLVKCLYTNSAGETSIGDYDVVPRLNTFLREHPDGAYHGARGMIAMTGYDGCFGYRTDIDYEVKENLTTAQSVWLDEHPDFNRQEEIREATIIADAIKAEGWEFASHTWGHLSVTQCTAEGLIADNDKWVANVANIVGPTDIIIFAHGNDIGDWQEYTTSNDKYVALKNAGYDFYCNVDGSVPYWVQIRSDYVRQGRINLDGYMLYRASIGETTVLDNLIDAKSVFDSRRPTPVTASGQG